MAVAPAVFTVMLQGLTVTVRPTARGWPAGTVDCVTAKMHEPKVVVPVAVLPSELMENAGVVEVLVNATVVVDVVPSDGTPAGKAKGVFVTAVVTAGDAGTCAFVVAISTGSGAPPPSLPPPPHPARVRATAAADMSLRMFFTG